MRDGDADAGIVGVGDGKLLMCCLPDHGGYAGDLCPMFGDQREALELADIGDDVEHAAPADIDPHLAQVGHVDFRIQMRGEGGDVAEGHGLDLAALTVGLDADQPGGGLQCKFGHRFLHREDAGFQQDGGDRDGVAARHHRVFDLLHDDVAGLRLGVAGGHQQVAAMRGVATGFAQSELAEMVVVRLKPFHLVIDGGAGDMADAAGYHPHGDAGMGVDGLNHAFEGHLGSLAVIPPWRAIPCSAGRRWRRGWRRVSGGACRAAPRPRSGLWHRSEGPSPVRRRRCR